VVALRHGGLSPFYPIVALAMGTAFAGGLYLRHYYAPEQLAATPTARLAQAPANGRNIFHRTNPTATMGGNTLHVAEATARPTAKNAPDEVLRSRRTFDTIYNLVRQYYVDRLPSDQKMSYSAIRSMLSSLNDPLCYFLEPEQYSLLEAEGQGVYPGIGASLAIQPQKRDGYTEYKIVVVAPLPGSPASKAGLKSGDVISHIDGRWVLGFNPYLNVNKLAKKLETSVNPEEDEKQYRSELQAARKKEDGGIGLLSAQLVLRGDRKIAEKLNLVKPMHTLTVQRSGAKEPLALSVGMGNTNVPKVEGKILPTGEGYIRIVAFTQTTDKEFKKALESVPTNKGLVIDLRRNAGGVLEAALRVESLLNPTKAGGVFIQQVSYSGKSAPVKSLPGIGKARPLSILVDGGTASMAEALAASLRDKGLATLVGGKTFGDGVIQSAFTLPDGAAFVIPTGKMLSPQKHSDWNTKGLQPKVAIKAGATEAQILAQAAEAARNGAQVVAKKETVR
jgi:carboxyl-terminal processing protease